MSDNLYVALSGALARLRELDVVANNLANVDTPGFKRDRAVFESALESAVQGTEGERVPGAPGRAFTRVGTGSFDRSEGAVSRTGAPLDVAIDGRGFFALETPGGTRYTRAGSFRVDSQGRLASPQGYPVLGEGGPIEVGSRPVTIRRSGEIADDQGTVVGRLQVVDFPDEVALAKHGDSMFRAPEGAAPQTLEETLLVPGAVERANVQPVLEMASLVMLQRAFDTAMQVLHADDQATQRLIREVS